MAQASCTNSPPIELPYSSDAEMLRTSPSSISAEEGLPEPKRRFYKSLDRPLIGSLAEGPLRERKGLHFCWSVEVHKAECSSRQVPVKIGHEAKRMCMQTRDTWKNCGSRSSLMNRALSVVPVKRKLTSWLLLAVAIITSMYTSLSAPSCDKSTTLEQLTVARLTLWEIAAAAVSENLLATSVIGAAFPLVIFVKPTGATDAQIGTGAWAASVSQRGRTHVTTNFIESPATQVNSLLSVAPSGETAHPKGGQSAENPAESVAKIREVKSEARGGKSITGQTAKTNKSTPQSFEKVDDKPAGSSLHRVFMSDSSHEHARLSKLLTILDNCYRDEDCFGNGRRCIEGRCWGFVGPVLRPFICRPGSVCKLHSLKGHFYGANSGKAPGLFKLKVYKGSKFDVCGGGGDPADASYRYNFGAFDHARRLAQKGASATDFNEPNLQAVSTSVSRHEHRKLVRVDPVSEQILEDHSLAGSTDGTCLALEPADCPIFFGSKVLFVQPKERKMHGRVISAVEDVLHSTDHSRSVGGEPAASRVSRVDLLQLNHAYFCNFPSALRPQPACEANLGVVSADMPTGLYMVCGCSGTDLSGAGTQCSSEEDFAVPVARLLVAGFSEDNLQYHHDQSDNSADVRSSRTTSNTQTTNRRHDIKSLHNTLEQETVASQVLPHFGARSPSGQSTGENEFHVKNFVAKRSSPSGLYISTWQLSDIRNPIAFSAAAGQKIPASLPGNQLGFESRPVYHCSVGKICLVTGIRGVALDTGAFYVDFFREQRRSCSARQEFREDKPVLRLPCRSYAAGSLCMVSLNTAALSDLDHSPSRENDGPAAGFSPSAKERHALQHDDLATGLVSSETPLDESPYLKSSPTSSKSFSPPSAQISASFGANQEIANKGIHLSNAAHKLSPQKSPARYLSDSSGRVQPGEPADVKNRNSSISAATTFKEEFSIGAVLRGPQGGFGDPYVSQKPLSHSGTPPVKAAANTSAAPLSPADAFVVTLCGCSSTEPVDSEYRCSAQVLLGYLEVHGSGFESASVGNPEMIPDGGAAGPTESKNELPRLDKEGVGAHDAREYVDEEKQKAVDDRDVEIVLRSSTTSARENIPAAHKHAAFEPSLLSTSATSARPAQSRSSPWRLLQYITGPAANSPSTRGTGETDTRTANECKVNTDCLSGMGVCDKGRCIGFIPDKEDSRLFRCVEGYWCDVKKGQIEGIGVSNEFEVIATSPSEPCGTARNLRPNESLFANANKWLCDASSSTSCIFRAGVGHRRNKSHTVEGVRLCGCPHFDVNGDGIPCNHVRDFFVPLGRLGVQECLTNAHCVDNVFAYCIEDHCGGFLVSAAAAGVNAFTCIRNQQCTLQSIAAKSVDQALKVIPVAANFSCGAEAALDPEYVMTSALPCIADVNNDGVCDINLGVNRALGTTRLCGCSGQDLGGNGRACDEAKDFDRDLGLVSNVQCIINQDCPPTAICAKGECVEDDLEPYIVSMLPQNNTFAVPPLSHVDLLFNENIKFGRPGAAILIANLQQPSYKYLITLPQNAASLKRVTAPLLLPGGGVVPRLGGGGGVGSGAGGIAAAAAPEGEAGGATAATGRFGRGVGGNHGNKVAERDGFTLYQNSHRASRKLGALNEGTTEANEAEERKQVDAVTAAGEKLLLSNLAAAEASGKSVKVGLKQPQQQQQSMQQPPQGRPEELALPSLRPASFSERQSSSNTSLMHPAGVGGGWRRGGGGGSHTNRGSWSSSASASSSSFSNSTHNNRWVVELQGQRLRITPDKDATSLPLGEYRIGIEYGFVSDLVGNYNSGENNLRFTLAKDAGCPYLYVTGFTTENGNCNGLYLPTDPMNEQASWQGGERNAFFIYWKREPREGGRPAPQDGNWIIDTNLEDSSFLAFADLHAHANKKQGRTRALPPSGLWHKWTGSSRSPQGHVQIHCTQQLDRVAASLIAIDPPIGAALQLSATTLLPLHPITLIFSKPMNYGHWAAIRLTPRQRKSTSSRKSRSSSEDGGGDSSDEEVVWYSDVEANMRGNAIRIYNKRAREVMPTFFSSSFSPSNSSDEFDSTSTQQQREESSALAAAPSSAASGLSADRSAASPRALQKRLFEQRERLQLPIRSLDIRGDHSPAHAFLTAQSNAPSPAAGAPESTTAEAKGDDVVGVVELYVQQPLLPGETYNFTVQLGALTDLSYNPWGPVESGIIVFHTTGGRCRTALSEENVVIQQPATAGSKSSSSGSKRKGSNRDAAGELLLNYAEAYVVLDVAGNPIDFTAEALRHRTDGRSSTEDAEKSPSSSSSASSSPFPVPVGGADADGEAQDGTQVRVRCRSGYSVHASARGSLKAEETVLHCRDGRWHGEQQLPKCFRNCGVYPMLGGAYQMAGDVGGEGVEGEVIDVQCTNTAELLSAVGRQAVRCSHGKWDALLVKCGATCPPIAPTLGIKYEVKQLELQEERNGNSDASSSGSYSKRGSREKSRRKDPSGNGVVSGAAGGRRGEKETMTEVRWVPETREAREGAVRRISCAPGSHSLSPSRLRRSSSDGFDALHGGRKGRGEEADEQEAAEEIRCGKDGWGQLHLQCVADCPVEQLAALLAQYGPGLEAAAGNFRDGRHGDSREISCDIGFAPAEAKFSRLFTTCDDGRWLPLSSPPSPEEAATASEVRPPGEREEVDEGQAKGSTYLLMAAGNLRTVCVPRCPPLQLPPAAYVVTPLPDARGADGSLQQQVQVKCAAMAASVALGGSKSSIEQLLTCSRAGVWGLLTLQCKAPCKAPLLQLGDRYEMRDGSSGILDDRGAGGVPQQADGGHTAADTAGGNDSSNDEGPRLLYSHGTERLIGCSPGAAVDGGGVSGAPHKIVCDDGLWQSAYRALRAGSSSSTMSNGNSSAAQQKIAAAVDLKCRRGCGPPPLPPGVSPSLLSPRALLLQQWQHEAQLRVKCNAGFSASHFAVLLGTGAASATKDNSGTADQQASEAARQEELLECRDGAWVSVLYAEQRNKGRSSFFSHSSRGIALNSGTHYRQLQQSPASSDHNATDATHKAKNGRLYLTLECRRDCAAAEVRRLAQQQHFEVQLMNPTSSGANAASYHLTAAPLRHGVSLAVTCQKNFESLSGLAPGTASAVSCSHGRLLLPRIICGRPSCSDGIQNGEETGVDCGGSICSPCAACSDGIQNYGETGVDCGGSCPPCHSCSFPPLGAPGTPSPVGMHHVIAVRVAQQAPHANRPNLSNLGGSVNSGPAEVSDDSSSADRKTNSSLRGVILDEYKSFEETSRYIRSSFSQGTADRPLLPPGSSLHVQCGEEATASGPAAVRRFAVLRCMPSGQWMWAAEAAAAAASFSALAVGSAAAEELLQPQLVCTPPTCFDGVRNGDETGVDCGGSCSRSCASCFNGIQDGEEEDVDCGGRDCEPCASCSPRLLKPFLMNSRTAFTVTRRGAVVGTSAAAAAGGMSTSSIPPPALLDQELAKGVMHPLLTAHGQQLQIKCRAADAPSTFLPSGGMQSFADATSSSIAAATAGAYYLQQPQPQPQGVRQPLPLTVYCRHGVWTTPAVAAASALALTKSAGAAAQQLPTSNSSSSAAASQLQQQQDSWLARAALEAHQALDTFRDTCTAYRRAAAESSTFAHSFDTNTQNGSDALESPPLGSGAPLYGSSFAARTLSTAEGLAAARRQLFWKQPHFAVFEVPDFRIKQDDSGLTSSTYEWGTLPGSERKSVGGDACISRLIETFRTSLRGECGALAFGNSSLKISSFCSNTCKRSLEAAIAAATRSPAPVSSLAGSTQSTMIACSNPHSAARIQSIAQLLQQLLDVWCTQRSGRYCFAEAEASFAFVQQLYFFIQSGTYYESELSAACPADSCFRSNIRHIVLLAQVSEFVDIQQPAAVSRTNNIAAAGMLGPTHPLRRTSQSSGSPARRLRQQQQQQRWLSETIPPTLDQKKQQQKSHQQPHQPPNEQVAEGQTLPSAEEISGVTLLSIAGSTHEEEVQGFSPGFTSAEEEAAEETGAGESTYVTNSARTRSSYGGEAYKAQATSSADTFSNLSARGTQGNHSRGGRRLLAVPLAASPAAVGDVGWEEEGTRRFLTDITNLPQIMDLLCMRVEGQSCAQEVLRVGIDNPVLQSPAADAEKTQRICMRDPCVLEVVRTFGQLLMDAADASISFPNAAAFPRERYPRSSGGSRGHLDNAAVERTRGANNSHSSQLFAVENETDQAAMSLTGGKTEMAPASAAGTGGRQETLEMQHHLTPSSRASLSPSSSPVSSTFRSSSSSLQPRDVVLGMLMKYWGRTFCHRNVHGALCGGFVFPSTAEATLAQESKTLLFPSWSSQRESRLHRCSCPVVFVGDGDCDVSCFSPECEWDGGDCLATEVVFPVYRHLLNQMGRELSEKCNPFNAAFTCSMGSADSDRRSIKEERRNIQSQQPLFQEDDCAAHFSKLAESRGCCLATQLEVLRDLLEADLRIIEATTRSFPPLSSEGSAAEAGAAASDYLNPAAAATAAASAHARQRSNSASYGEEAALKVPPTNASPPQRWRRDVWLQVDRSSSFFESACQQQLDRTCSRGLNRYAYGVEFKIGNLSYDQLLQPPSASASPFTAVDTHAQLSSSSMTRGLVAETARERQHPSSSRARHRGSSTGSSLQQHGSKRGDRSKSSKTYSTFDSAESTGVLNGSKPKGALSVAAAVEASVLVGDAADTEKTMRQLLLQAEMSPKLHELRRLVREELAAIFSVPAADVIEMRLWGGSIDVRAVIDAGWLSNRRSFKERVESLTADPSSSTALSARLSAGLTRHLSYIPLFNFTPSTTYYGAAGGRLPLLALMLPTFARISFEEDSPLSASDVLPQREGEAGGGVGAGGGGEKQILVAPEHVVVERLPQLQQVRYHFGAAAADSHANSPLFGTFGVSELPTESRGCVGAQGLHPAEGSSLAEAYRLFYKTTPAFAPAAVSGTKQHGSTMVVECNVGHEAVAGKSPQELICNQGRWEPLFTLENALSNLLAIPHSQARAKEKQPSFSTNSSPSSSRGSSSSLFPGHNNVNTRGRSLDGVLVSPSNAKMAEIVRSDGLLTHSTSSPSGGASLASPTFSTTEAAGAGSATSGSASAAARSAALTHVLNGTGRGAVSRVLVCRRPCLPYEKVDPAILRAEFVVSGMGSSDGDKRSIFCAPGYSPRDAETFNPAQQTLACVNGVWLPRRTLICEKDFAAVSGSSASSPCSGALSGLEERYRLTEVPLSSAANPDISVDLGNALNARLQPKGVSLQVFKITCARGYTHQHAAAPSGNSVLLQQQQQQQGQQQQHQISTGGSGRNSGEIYVACLNGILIGFGTDELFPHGGSAEGQRAGKLAAAFEMRLRQHSEITIKIDRRKLSTVSSGAKSAAADPVSRTDAVVVLRARNGAAEATAAAAQSENYRVPRKKKTDERRRASNAREPRQLQADVDIDRYAAFEEVDDEEGISFSGNLRSAADNEEEQVEEDDNYVQRKLKCERDIRTAPSVGAKPVSDTVMVFLCLLVLFALTVFFLAGWWIWNTKKKRRANAAAEEAMQESGEDSPPAASAEAKDWGCLVVPPGASKGWYPAGSRDEGGEYYMQNTAPSISHVNGNGNHNGIDIMSKHSPDLTAEVFEGESNGVLRSDEQRLLFSRYYWLAAAAAAAGTATAEAAAEQEAKFDPGHQLAISDENNQVGNGDDSPTGDMLATPLIFEQAAAVRDRAGGTSEVDVEGTDQQRLKHNRSSLLSPKCILSDTAGALASTDLNPVSTASEQSAMLHVLLRKHLRPEQLLAAQQQMNQQHPEVDKEAGEASKSQCETQKGFSTKPPLFSHGEKITKSYALKGQEECSCRDRANSTDDLSLPYLRGLPGDRGSAVEIREQSALDGKSELTGATSSVLASTIAATPSRSLRMDHRSYPAQLRKNNSPVTTTLLKQAPQLRRMLSHQQQERMPAHSASGIHSESAVSYGGKHVDPASALSWEAAETASLTAHLPERLKPGGCVVPSVAETTLKREQQLLQEWLLPQQQPQQGINATGPDEALTARLSPVILSARTETETVESSPFMHGVRRSDCTKDNASLCASEIRNAVMRHQALVPDNLLLTNDDPSEDILTFTAARFCGRDLRSHGALSEQRPAPLRRLRSTSSSCSSISRDHRVVRVTGSTELGDAPTKTGQQAAATDIRGEPVTTETAVAVGFAKGAIHNSLCTRSSSRPRGRRKSSAHIAAAANHQVQRAQKERACKASAVDAHTIPALSSSQPAGSALSSEDELYPEDSASCVGQQGYQGATRMSCPDDFVESADLKITGAKIMSLQRHLALEQLTGRPRAVLAGQKTFDQPGGASQEHQREEQRQWLTQQKQTLKQLRARKEDETRQQHHFSAVT